jgi:hypothetical protein
MRHAKAVSSASNAAEQARLSKQTGIKGIPILSSLGSLTFPNSFPTDFMHLIYENLLPQLLDLWTGDYKGFDAGIEAYTIAPTVLSAIGEAVKKSGNTIPSTYGCRVPNPFTERGNFTAEAWSMWGLLLAPILLQRRFIHSKYYVHFIKLIGFLNTCLKLKVTADEIDNLEIGLAQWVTEFERFDLGLASTGHIHI